MNNILFIGTYQRKVDSKGRLSIPAEWRKKLDNKIFIFEPAAYWCFKSIEDFNDFLSPEIKADKLQYTQCLSGLYQYNIDKEGRVLLKQEWECIATLKGCGNYFTIEFLD
jgi:DNA-binding transcriptional regulator/RsmH inhibitor MraZ